jgi:hypothetical protein
MRSLSLIGIILAAAAHGQPAMPVRPLGTWTIEYEHTVTSMHAEPRKEIVHGRMALRQVGDSVLGDLTLGDSATGPRSILRGTARKEAWSVYAEDPAARGMGIFFSAIGSMMDWLRETVHGIPPVVVRFELAAKGDSLTGSRIITGGMGGTRQSAIVGRRIKP